MSKQPKDTVSARVSPDVVQFIEEMAHKHGMTRSEVVESMLRSAMRFELTPSDGGKLIDHPRVIAFLTRIANDEVHDE